MEYETYTKGETSIQATETTYELLYKDQGYKLARGTGRSADAGNKDGADDDGSGSSAGNNDEGQSTTEK